MKRMTLCMCLIAALALGCQSIPQNYLKPSVEGVSPVLEGVDFEGVDMGFDLDIKNPYPMSIAIPDIAYDLKIEGRDFVSGTENSDAKLPAVGTGTVRVPVRVNYEDLAKIFGKITDQNEFAYALDGSVGYSTGYAKLIGDKAALDFGHEGTLPILRAPTLKVKSFKPGKVSLMKTGFTLQAEMHNPNSFDIGLGDVGYALKIGDKSVGDLKIRSAGSIGAEKTGQLEIGGALSGVSALGGLMSGDLGALSLAPTGRIKTPYGDVALPGARK